MSNELHYESDQYDYSTDGNGEFAQGRSKPRGGAKNVPSRGRKRGKTPTSVNGIHRRRRRKIAW